MMEGESGEQVGGELKSVQQPTTHTVVCHTVPLRVIVNILY